ncbi:MAG: dTDP-4-dehydrorhamnose reductase [Pontibacterium sp.]
MSQSPYEKPATILITGATGQVGEAVYEMAEGDRFFNPIGLSVKQLDITSLEQVRARLDEYLPDYVINCAAFNRVDAAQHEKDRCFDVNTKGVENLAQVCGDLSIPMIHLSSDFVFDGHYESAYLETDDVTPLGVYGQSKWQGEEALRRRLPQHIVLRVSWIFSRKGDNFVTRTLDRARTRLELRAVSDRHGCPTAASDVARVILAMLKQIHCGAEVWGTYHYSGAEPTTRYSFCKEIITQAMSFEQLVTEKLSAVTAEQYKKEVQRPSSSILDCRKILNTFGIRQRPWRTDLSHEVREHYQARKQQNAADAET